MLLDSSRSTGSAMFIAGLVNSKALYTSSRWALLRKFCHISHFALRISVFIAFLAAHKRSAPPDSCCRRFAWLTALRLASIVSFHQRFDLAHNLIRRAF
jgi:hypothetical protein